MKPRTHRKKCPGLFTGQGLWEIKKDHRLFLGLYSDSSLLVKADKLYVLDGMNLEFIR
jgi:hypothetical protein